MIERSNKKWLISYLSIYLKLWCAFVFCRRRIFYINQHNAILTWRQLLLSLPAHAARLKSHNVSIMASASVESDGHPKCIFTSRIGFSVTRYSRFGIQNICLHIAQVNSVGSCKVRITNKCCGCCCSWQRRMWESGLWLCKLVAATACDAPWQTMTPEKKKKLCWVSRCLHPKLPPQAFFSHCVNVQFRFSFQSMIFTDDERPEIIS